MRMVIGVIVGISFAVLVLLGIIALVCWHKYNNTKEQDILKNTQNYCINWNTYFTLTY